MILRERQEVQLGGNSQTWVTLELSQDEQRLSSEELQMLYHRETGRTAEMITKVFDENVCEAVLREVPGVP